LVVDFIVVVAAGGGFVKRRMGQTLYIVLNILNCKKKIPDLALR
jgi:hypothetical protein